MASGPRADHAPRRIALAGARRPVSRAGSGSCGDVRDRGRTGAAGRRTRRQGPPGHGAGPAARRARRPAERDGPGPVRPARTPSTVLTEVARTVNAYRSSPSYRDGQVEDAGTVGAARLAPHRHRRGCREAATPGETNHRLRRTSRRARPQRRSSSRGPPDRRRPAPRPPTSRCRCRGNACASPTRSSARSARRRRGRRYGWAAGPAPPTARGRSGTTSGSCRDLLRDHAGPADPGRPREPVCRPLSCPGCGQQFRPRSGVIKGPRSGSAHRPTGARCSGPTGRHSGSAACRMRQAASPSPSAPAPAPPPRHGRRGLRRCSGRCRPPPAAGSRPQPRAPRRRRPPRGGRTTGAPGDAAHFLGRRRRPEQHVQQVGRRPSKDAAPSSDNRRIWSAPDPAPTLQRATPPAATRARWCLADRPTSAA